MKNKTMTTSAQEYLDFRRSLGFKLKTEGMLLLKFAAYADEQEHQGPVTVQLALNWASLSQRSTRLYKARRLEIVRCFAKYQAIFDSRTEIPDKGLLGAAHRRKQPHIYSPEEISALMQAAKQLTPQDGLRPKTYVTLLGLLTSTGLRISEALNLRCEHLDWKESVLTVQNTKFAKSRLVPLHPSTIKELRRYEQIRDQLVSVSDENFFVSDWGKQLKYSTVRSTFKALCCKLGWKASGEKRRPRLYDLRHTFACRRLIQWYCDGVNIDCAISSLSTYMGHVKVADTYWYLTGVPELMEIAGARFELFAIDPNKEVV